MRLILHRFVWRSLQESVKVDLDVWSVPQCSADCRTRQLRRAGSSCQSVHWWSCVITLSTCQSSHRTHTGVTSAFKPHCLHTVPTCGYRCLCVCVGHIGDLQWWLMTMMGVSGWMFLLVPAHLGCRGQNPKNRKTDVCVLCVCFKIHFIFSFYKFFCPSFLFLYYISFDLNNYFSFYANHFYFILYQYCRKHLFHFWVVMTK